MWSPHSSLNDVARSNVPISSTFTRVVSLTFKKRKVYDFFAVKQQESKKSGPTLHASAHERTKKDLAETLVSQESRVLSLAHGQSHCSSGFCGSFINNWTFRVSLQSTPRPVIQCLLPRCDARARPLHLCSVIHDGCHAVSLATTSRTAHYA